MFENHAEIGSLFRTRVITYFSIGPPLKRTRINGTRIATIKTTHPSSLPSMPSPTTKACRRRGFHIPPPDLKTIFEISEERVSFADVSFTFPLPPVLSSSPWPSSPDSQEANLPLTPTSSDDDEMPPPSRAAIKPLVINKFQRPETLPTIDDPSQEPGPHESDSQWYSQQFSKFLTLDTSASSTYLPAAHRDSFYLVPPCHPPFSSSSYVDPSPMPPRLSHQCARTLPCRPLPRIGIPDDVDSAFFWDADEVVVDRELSPVSMSSRDSESSDKGYQSDGDGFPEDVEERCSMLPPSFPGSPLDLEADRLEEQPFLHDRNLGFGFVFEDADDVKDDKLIELVTPPPPLVPVCSPSPSRSRVPAADTHPPLPPLHPLRRSTSISSLSYPSSSISSHESLPTEEYDDDYFDERRLGLKSRWSSSTLGSVRVGQETSILKFPNLKMYFRGTTKHASTPSPKLSIPSFRGKEKKDEKKEKEKKKKKKKKKGRESQQNRPEGAILIVGLDNETLSIRPEDSFLPNLDPLQSPHREFFSRHVRFP